MRQLLKLGQPKLLSLPYYYEDNDYFYKISDIADGKWYYYCCSKSRKTLLAGGPVNLRSTDWEHIITNRGNGMRPSDYQSSKVLFDKLLGLT